MHEKLCEMLHDLHLWADLKLKSEDMDMLTGEELQNLFRCRDLSKQLADAIFKTATAFYRNKILA